VAFYPSNLGHSKLEPILTATSATPKWSAVPFFDGISTPLSLEIESSIAGSQLGPSFKLRELGSQTDRAFCCRDHLDVTFLRKFVSAAGGTAVAIARE